MSHVPRGIFATLLYLTVLILLVSCAGTGDQALIKKAPFESRSHKLNEELVTKSFTLKRGDAASDYKIGPEDLLEIDVFQVEELKTSARVTSQGYIKLPLAGSIKASGLTVSELEDEIAVQLEKYLEEPVVSVFVKEYRSQQITVTGAVENPQVFTVSGQKYLLDMLSMAGGLTEEAKNLCYIQKFHEPDSTGNVRGETMVVDLKRLLVGGFAELNVPISSGDIIHVPESDVFFVDGAVASPGSYKIKGEVTLTQALSMAKGLIYEAERDNIRIYRDNGEAEREVLTLNYDDILEGNDADVLIKDRDIIIVPKSGMKSLLRGLATTFNFGLFSVGRRY